MKCSKCWLHEKGCLDGAHHREVNLMLAAGADHLDVPCRAMRAVLRACRAANDCRGCPPSRAIRSKCGCASGGGTIESTRAKYLGCWARYATGGGK